MKSQSRTVFATSPFAAAIAELGHGPLGKNLGAMLSSVAKIDTRTDQAVAVLFTQAIAKGHVPMHERAGVLEGMENVKNLVDRSGQPGSSGAVEAIEAAMTTVKEQPEKAPVVANGGGDHAPGTAQRTGQQADQQR
jgi:hypothetical protein